MELLCFVGSKYNKVTILPTSQCESKQTTKFSDREAAFLSEFQWRTWTLDNDLSVLEHSAPDEVLVGPLWVYCFFNVRGTVCVLCVY
jgi:hypothetical protein